jgi:acetylornithine deacetylase/succinyl-diaminopimelate desuccinylase-like protein
MNMPFDLLSEAQRLIRFNTVTTQSNTDCAVYLGSLMRQLGLQVAYQESRVGLTSFLNVIGTLGEGISPLLLVTHLDTVSASDPLLWTKTGRDPWKLTRKGNTLYGLGVADTKLDFICKLTALAKLSKVRLKRPVSLLGTFGEESGLRGAARFCQGDFPRPKMALVSEPTQLALVNRHKGLAVMEVIFRSRGLHRPSAAQWSYEMTFIGQASHSSTPKLGINALEASCKFLEETRKKHQKVAVLSWTGGSGHNIIPDKTVLRISLGDPPKCKFTSTARRKVKAQRLQPGWYPNLPWKEAIACIEMVRQQMRPLEKLKDSAFVPSTLTWNLTRLIENREGWGMTFDVRALPGQAIHPVLEHLEKQLWEKMGPPGTFWQFRIDRDNPGLDLPASHALVKSAQAALRSMRRPTRLATKVGCSEAGLLKQMGVPSLVFGPGLSTGNIHRPNEQVSIAQLKGAIKFYEKFLERTCL